MLGVKVKKKNSWWSLKSEVGERDGEEIRIEEERCKIIYIAQTG